MRKIIVIIIIILSNDYYLISLDQKKISHDQEDNPIHQRIVVEAYKLLKLQFSREVNGFADIDQYIGNVETFSGNTRWQDVNSISKGSWHEDVEDIVYHRSGIFGQNTSISHFVDADAANLGGDIYLYEGTWAPSAYKKACTYIWDDWVKEIIEGISGGHRKRWCAPESYNYLYSWYWKDKIWVNFSHEIYWYRFGIPTNKLENYWWNVGNEFCRKIFYNLLGRLCHLLTDIGVSEHAKRSSHPTGNYGLLNFGYNTAPFEHWLSDEYDKEFYWTAERVYKERGGFINPFCEVNGDRNLFLFYTTAQLSDWFFSAGLFRRNGNDNYNSNVGEINSIINSYAPVNEREIYQSLWNRYYGGIYWGEDPYPSLLHSTGVDLSNELGKKFREVLIPYTIRAVAGMLYKFIIESKMQFPVATVFDQGSIYDQQQELDLFNQDIDGNYYTFRAEGTPGRITVCSENRPEGYPADFIIGPNARNVTFRASKEIVFKPGFSALEGSQVRAYIVPGCSRSNQSGNCQECLDEDFNPKYDKSN